jgi:hypothetical protein
MTTVTDTACYVFGVVPVDAPVPAADADGLAAGLQLVACGEVAALVSPVPPGRPLGRAADLRAHNRVHADLVAAGTAVLPMRFGAVLADVDAVRRELLEPHQGQFAEALAELRGRVQYTVKARYEQDVVLQELLARHPEIRRLHGCTDDRGAQLRLGQLIVRALEQQRPDEASALLTDLLGTVDVHVREVSAPEEILDAAFLVETDKAAQFERQVEQLAARHAGRLRIRLVGPSAAYDFVGDG